MIDKQLLKWQRNESGSLYLKVFENEKWIDYKQSSQYVPDATLSSNSGFATAQKYLSNGFKYLRVIEIKEYFSTKSPPDLFSEIQSLVLDNLLIELDLNDISKEDLNKLLEVYTLLKTAFGVEKISDFILLNNASAEIFKVLYN